jgi:hypothetical protein
MKIGTLSFEVGGKFKEMVLPAAERREIIARVVAQHKPALLVCAGFSLDDNYDLRRLVANKQIQGSNTNLIVEVRGGPRSDCPSSQQIIFDQSRR